MWGSCTPCLPVSYTHLPPDGVGAEGGQIDQRVGDGHSGEQVRHRAEGERPHVSGPPEHPVGNEENAHEDVKDGDCLLYTSFLNFIQTLPFWKTGYRAFMKGV